jgi:integrase
MLVEPGLYRRGDTYEIRVGYRDPGSRKRRERWRTIGTSKRAAKAALLEARAAAQRGTMVSRAAESLTVADLLEEHFLPYLEEERMQKAQSIHPNTVLKYRGYAKQKVVPLIGRLRVAELNPGDIERLLNQLRVGGRHPHAGVGRPRRRPDVVYDLIWTKRTEEWSYDDIARWLAATRPGDCADLTKNAVAGIHRRFVSASPSAAAGSSGLSVSTVKKVHTMLRGAWKFGINHELIARDRAHVIADAPLPALAKGEPKPEIALWEPRDYARFFDWAAKKRPESWDSFYFVATSGDRKSGNLGLTWPEVDLNQGVVRMTRYVKYHGKPRERVLIESFGKTTGGYEIELDSRTIAILRDRKARQGQYLLTRADRHVCTTPERNCPLPGYHDRGLVFPQRDGNYRDPNKYLDLFKGAIRAYNRDNPADPLPVITLHALRHGWSTVAAELGISETIRMARLGQSTPAINRRYTHAQPAAMRSAAQAVSDAMFMESTELGQRGA